MPVHPQWVTTALEFDGHRIVGYLGVVRGIVGAAQRDCQHRPPRIQTLFGGNITLFTEFCERRACEAFDLLLGHAAEMRANAVIGIRYDANEVDA